MFSPGDEVVCVNDSDPPQQPPNVVVLNSTYTVVAVEQRWHPVHRMSGGITIMALREFVFLREVPSPKGIGFFAFRFRKVEKKSTDISIFREIADGTRVVPLEPTVPVRRKEDA